MWTATKICHLWLQLKRFFPHFVNSWVFVSFPFFRFLQPLSHQAQLTLSSCLLFLFFSHCHYPCSRSLSWHAKIIAKDSYWFPVFSLSPHPSTLYVNTRLFPLKHCSLHLTSLLKTLQWLTPVFEIKSRLFSWITYNWLSICLCFLTW